MSDQYLSPGSWMRDAEADECSKRAAGAIRMTMLPIAQTGERGLDRNDPCPRVPARNRIA